MKSWYKIAKKEKDFNIKIANDSKIDAIIEDLEGEILILNVLEENGYEAETVRFPYDSIISVETNQGKKVIVDFDYPETQDAEEWINSMPESELYSLIPLK
jgi:hypothetical protein